MADEKLKFMDMLSMMRVIDDDIVFVSLRTALSSNLMLFQKKLPNMAGMENLLLKLNSSVTRKTKTASIFLRKLKKQFRREFRLIRFIEIQELVDFILMILIK